MNFILKILFIFLKNNYDDSYILCCYLKIIFYYYKSKKIKRSDFLQNNIFFKKIR